MTVPLTATHDVDRDAPVISHEQLTIDAPLDLLWGLHTDISSWPTWRGDVTGAELTGPFAMGSAFRWQTAGLDITSTISQVVPGSRTVWGGPERHRRGARLGVHRGRGRNPRPDDGVLER